MKWPWQRAEPWTVHVGIAAGMAYRLRIHDDGRMEFAYGPAGAFRPVERMDEMDKALMRTARWTPPLPPDTKWP